MVQNNNEHEKIPEEGKNLNSSEMDKLKNDLEKEENEAIGSSKYARTDLLHELESHESQKDSREAQSYFNHAESREGDKGKKTPEYGRHQDMFHEITTEAFKYPFFKKTFPRLVSILEESKLGKNLFVDVGGLGVGGAESSLSVAILGRDLLVDTAKFTLQPRAEYHRTKLILEDIESQKTKQILEDNVA